MKIKNSGVKEILRKPCSLDDLTELIEKYRPTTNINQNQLETLNHMNGINPLTRILLVDDDKDHLKLFTMILEGEGYSVDAYADPVTALQNFRPNYYVVTARLPNASSNWSRICIDELGS